MFKITVFITLVVIASVAFASSLSCQSCGSECASACGTRRFRTCCFNYLRKKRGPDAKFLYSHPSFKPEAGRQRPGFNDDLDLWSALTNDYKSSSLDDMVENALHYDA